MSALARYGEKLSAVVSLVAIGVLLLILNWFFHSVYWTGHMAGPARQEAAGAARRGGGVLAAPFALACSASPASTARASRRCCSCRRWCSRPARATVLLGVLVGLAATALVGVAVFSLQRKLPYKKMLMLTGAMVAWVLVVLVGTTVQMLQAVGWMPVSPIEGLQLPYWAGSGSASTRPGRACCCSVAAVFVIGSYFAAEAAAQPPPQPIVHARPARRSRAGTRDRFLTPAASAGGVNACHVFARPRS